MMYLVCILAHQVYVQHEMSFSLSFAEHFMFALLCFELLFVNKMKMKMHIVVLFGMSFPP